MLGTALMDAGGAGLLDVVSNVLLAGGVVVVLAAGTAATVVAITVRRVRRSGALAAASLRLHAITDTGPRREVARLRLQLRRAVEGGEVAIRAGDASAGLPGETSALFRRIRREALALDAHLRVMQTEDDHETLRAALPALRRRVEEIVRLVRQLRAAVADGLAAVSADSMAELGSDVEREVIALRAGRERLRQAGLSSGRPWTDEGSSR
jgi:hypothetical protein